LLLPIVERNYFPDWLLRIGIRQELEMELAKIKKLSIEERASALQKFVEELKVLPIAIQQQKANDQHYEVPDAFYQLVLGPYMKYSSGYWPANKPYCTLAESEIHMLEMYCERAELRDGMTVVDLGCGWGSVTLYLAKKYPNSSIVSISNSNSQREYILDQAEKRGYKNVKVRQEFTQMISVYIIHRSNLYDNVGLHWRYLIFRSTSRASRHC
jgi:cyclopropane-fatty-acyl-phospholipid synthase